MCIVQLLFSTIIICFTIMDMGYVFTEEEWLLALFLNSWFSQTAVWWTLVLTASVGSFCFPAASCFLPLPLCQVRTQWDQHCRSIPFLPATADVLTFRMEALISCWREQSALHINLCVQTVLALLQWFCSLKLKHTAVVLSSFKAQSLQSTLMSCWASACSQPEKTEATKMPLHTTAALCLGFCL